MIRQGQGNERHLIVLPLLCCLTRLSSTSSPTNPAVIFGVCLLHQFFLRSFFILLLDWSMVVLLKRYLNCMGAMDKNILLK
ncbi:hypothetical protein PAHAL_4G357300 [Panicum hallii]|uniref:Uncharacterized protein n=1 Tax=Panicum hallii TaxID=206008 RepID=A0A2S3HN25_9POAL|nr:hypothetical protein PAHAL_4G357300 [Panicum hallii]